MMYARCRRLLGLIVLAAAPPLLLGAPIPPGWDLTFKAQRAVAPPGRPGDPLNLFEEIDRRQWQIRYLLQQVPLDSIDAAVFVQESFSHHYGLFVANERAFLLWERNSSLFNFRQVDAAAARQLIQAYQRHGDWPNTWSAETDEQVRLPVARPRVRAVASTYMDGKARQFWLSGGDFAGSLPDPFAPLMDRLCGGHCHTTNKGIDHWATLLRQEMLSLPSLPQTSRAASVQALIRANKCKQPGPAFDAAIEPNGMLESGTGLLRWAMASDDTRCAVQWLLQHGADPEARDYFGHRAGPLAAQVALSTVTGLHAQPTSDRNAGWLVTKALLLQDTADLLQRGGTAEAMCQQLHDLLGLGPRNTRAARGDFTGLDAEVMAAASSLLANLDASCTSPIGSPLLHVLVTRGATSLVELAVQRGFPVNEGDPRTPLDVAISEKRSDVQQILLRAGAVQGRR